MALDDATLAVAASTGDAASLAILLQRHHASLLGLAVSIVGHDDAEDVVHDAFLVALRRIGDLHDHGAAGAWLRAIVRTECLMRLRGRREHPLSDLSERAGNSLDALPEEELEQLALRDWVWAALEGLTEPLRLVAVLRYFGTRSSYEEIALILDVPVGTVRSRLNQVRLKLADRLLKEATAAHPDISRRQAESERHFHEALTRVNGGDFSGYAHNWSEAIVGHCRTDGDSTIRGRDHLIRVLHANTPAVGVQIHLERVIASDTVTVLEARFENPADDPGHCPPATTQVHLHPGGRTTGLLLAFAPPDSTSAR